MNFESLMKYLKKLIKEPKIKMTEHIELIKYALELRKRKNNVDFSYKHITEEMRDFSNQNIDLLLNKIDNKNYLKDYIMNPKYWSDAEYTRIKLLFESTDNASYTNSKVEENE